MYFHKFCWHKITRNYFYTKGNKTTYDQCYQTYPVGVFDNETNLQINLFIIQLIEFLIIRLLFFVYLHMYLINISERFIVH